MTKCWCNIPYLCLPCSFFKELLRILILSLTCIWIAVDWLEMRGRSFDATYMYTAEKVWWCYFCFSSFCRLTYQADNKLIFYAWICHCSPVMFIFCVCYVLLFSWLHYYANVIYTSMQGYFWLSEEAKLLHDIRTVNVTIPAQHSCFGNRLAC